MERSKKIWEPLGSSSDLINNNNGFSSTETFGSILTQNNKTFTDNTIKIINDDLKGSPVAARTYGESAAFRPWNQWVASRPTSPPSKPQEGGSPNRTPPTDPTQTPPEEPPLDEELLKKLENPTESLILAPGGLRYPLKMDKKQDIIKFQACQIKPRNIPQDSFKDAQSGFMFKFPEPTVEPATGPDGVKEGPVVLSVQSPISDQNSVEWGGDSIGAIQSAAFAKSYNIATADTPQQVGNEIKSIFTELYGTAREFKDRIQKLAAAEAAGINNILARTDNVVLNPNLELLFNSPQLRPFTFTFKLSAREELEATQIKKIIKYFKYHMAVRREEKNLFLKAPHVFQIKYEYYDEKTNQLTSHPGLNLIKNCALTNFSVDYTPLGSYATYRDGTMVAYTLNMQFQELTPIYDSDYTKDSLIGY